MQRRCDGAAGAMGVCLQHGDVRSQRRQQELQQKFAAYQQRTAELQQTAQRREQNLQGGGISVTAFSGAQVEEMGFVNTVDVAQMTPNLNYTVPNAESSQVNFFLRGVGLNDFADAQENPVAVYVDDVYKPAMGGLALQLFAIGSDGAYHLQIALGVGFPGIMFGHTIKSALLRRQPAALTTSSSAPTPNSSLIIRASSPTVMPWRDAIGYIPTNDVCSGSRTFPSTISPPIGFGRSRTTNSTSFSAAASIAIAIVHTNV